ncbi:helix-turn-helix domain-containing protein [Alteribacillus sp. HJP-4]|uniref:helix-turn-helix domain-containing protein n=1 Tax=Alteribacillus sp. HJP-4 TaxID=2775394 RepID=UPI0035CD19E1
MDLNRLGKEIHYFRSLRGLSQQELARDICNQSEISRIESGKAFPTLQTLYFISLKLNVPITYLLHTSMNERVDYIEETMSLINELVLHKQYKEVYELTKAELKRTDELEGSYVHFLRWQHAVAAFEMNRMSIEECIGQIEAALQDQTARFLFTAQGLEEKMCNSLAILYAEKKHFSRSFYYYDRIISQETMSQSDPELLLKVFYNYGKALFEAGELEKAEKIINKGIRQSKKLGNMTFLGQLYYQRGCCKETREEPSASKDFFKAYAFMEETGKVVLQAIIYEEKEDYFMNETVRSLYPFPKK